MTTNNNKKTQSELIEAALNIKKTPKKSRKGRNLADQDVFHSGTCPKCEKVNANLLPNGLCVSCSRDRLEVISEVNIEALREKLEYIMRFIRITLDENSGSIYTDAAFVPHTIKPSVSNLIKKNPIENKEQIRFGASALYSCELKRWFSTFHPEFEEIQEDTGAMHVGTAEHGLIQSILRPFFHTEVSVSHDIKEGDLSAVISGSIDILLKNMIIDIKTTSEYGFKYLKNNPLTTKPHYRNQLNFYAILSNRKYFGVIFVNSKNLEYKVDVMEADFGLFMDDVMACKRILRGAPTAEANFKWECKYCPFKAACHKTYQQKTKKVID